MSSDLKLFSIIKANLSRALTYLAFHAIESTLLLLTHNFFLWGAVSRVSLSRVRAWLSFFTPSLSGSSNVTTISYTLYTDFLFT
jgi:hypothetical protein